MNLPPAIREEHNPFALAGFFGGLQRLFIFIRWTSYACPHCKGIFRRDFWPANVRLGSGEHVCRKCGKVFDNGAREWPELTLGTKLRFFLPPPLVAISGGFVVAGVLSFFITPRDEHSLLVVAVVSAFGLVPVLVWSPVRLIWVLRSKQRYLRELPQDLS